MSAADKDCCQPAKEWSVQPKGTVRCPLAARHCGVQTVGPVKAYVTNNLNSAKGPVIVLVHDVFGWRNKNLRHAQGWSAFRAGP